MKTEHTKLSPANVDRVIAAALDGRRIELVVLTATCQRLGWSWLNKSARPERARGMRKRVICEALEIYAKSITPKGKTGKQAWRQRLVELWSSGELTEDSAFAIVMGFIKAVSEGAHDKPEAGEAVPPTPKRRANIYGVNLVLEDETCIALFDMARYMSRTDRQTCWNDADEFGHFQSVANQMVRSMCEAVVRFRPSPEIGFRIPVAFDARTETPEETSIRLLLEQMTKEPV